MIGKIDLKSGTIEDFDMLKPFLIVPVIVFLTSCKEKEKSDDRLLFEAQEEELANLQAELVEVRAQAKVAKADAPKVPAGELRLKLATAKSELDELKGKFEELEEAQKKAAKKLADYQEKFPLR